MNRIMRWARLPNRSGGCEVEVWLDSHEEPSVYDLKRAVDKHVEVTLYRAQLGDVGSFLCHDHKYERGFGGAVFELKLRDGSVVAVKGPWTSRSGVINRAFPEKDPLIEVVRGSSWIYVSVPRLIELGCPLVRTIKFGDEVYWEIESAER